jgi:cation transport ATPase
MVSTLRNTIEFLKEFGLFDVVLPFLLVFAIVFAILEKTFLLGKEKDGSPRKNLNSVVALVLAFLVIAVNKAVNFLTNMLPNIVLLMTVGLSFLMLIGVFLKTGELDFKEKHPGWYKTFFIIMFIGLVVVVLGAYEVNGTSALMYLLEKLKVSDSLISGVILILIIVGIMYFITRGTGGSGEEGGG